MYELTKIEEVYWYDDKEKIFGTNADILSRKAIDPQHDIFIPLPRHANLKKLRITLGGTVDAEKKFQ